MRLSHLLRRVACAAALLLGVAQPAWALGDFIIPQAAGLVVGGPVLMALLFGLVHAATKGDKADLVRQKQWGSVALWAALFDGLWLGLLFVFDPHTWFRPGGWSAAGFDVRYLLPSTVLAAFLVFKGWPRRALVVAATCLLVGMGYWLLIALR